MVNPGSYTQVAIISLEHTLQATSESVVLNYTAPAGIKITFSPTSPLTLSGSSTGQNVTMIVTASSTASIGNHTIGINATSGSVSQSATFNLRVVQYRVVMVHNAFVPAVLNVTAGSTVYWQNLDGPAGGCGASGGSGKHSVVFTTLPVNSSSVSQFAFFSYTFTTPGSYFYYSSFDTDHVMNGTINVLAAAGGAGGMAPRLPSFSHFKGGTTLVPSKTSSADNVQGIQWLSGGVALGELISHVVLRAVLVGVPSRAGSVLVGLVGLGTLLAALALMRRDNLAIHR
jgi:plastocyanin